MKMRKQNLITPVILSALLPTLLLSGCGGGDDDSASNESNVPATGPVVEQAPVSARDGFETIAPNTPGFVDLTSLVQSGTDGATITDITLVSSQGSGQCGEVTTDNTSSLQGFNVTIDGAAICQYSYEVESIAAEPQARMRASARVMVASSTGGSAVLMPISVPLAINDTHVTDIEAELGMDFPAGYSLSPDFSVLGDGDVTADISAMSISYTATAEGVSRVVYVLEGNIAGTPDIKMGTIDYAVSDELNNAPTANSFTFNEQTELSTVYDVDVSAYIEDAVDSDTLQLIAVSSYTADVAAKDNNDLSNKVFTFEASSYGMHYVSYTVSDHRGGFATGIVEIAIADPDTINLWDDVEDGLLTYSAPLTRIEADALGISYQGVHSDTNYYPGVDVVTFSFEGANDYCNSLGGRLPTNDELGAFYDKHGSAVQWNWPVGKSYVGLGGSATDWLRSLSDGSAAKLGSLQGYVTCRGEGLVSLISDNNIVVADGSQSATLTVNFQRDAEPVSNASFMVEITGSGVLSETSVTTEADGTASVTVSNTIAETVNVSFTYATNQSDMIVASKDVDFIADVDTAQIDALQVLSDMSPNDGIDQNLLQVSVVDNGGNAIEGALVDVSFSSTTAQVFGEVEDLLTDENGLLIFGVTNTVAESVDVEVSLSSLDYGYSSLSVTSEFLDANAVIITPDTFTRSGAFAFCSNMSMRPATQSEYRDYLDKGNALSEEKYWETGEVRTSSGYYPYFSVAEPEANNGAVNISLKGVLCVPTANSGLVGVGLGNGQSTFESLSGDTVANGVDTADFIVTLLDKYGVPAEGENVYFAVNGAADTLKSDVITDENGKAQVQVTNTVTEQVEVQAFFNGVLAESARFIVDESTADIAYSDFTTLVNNSMADGSGENVVLFVLRNQFSNPVPGKTAYFSVATTDPVSFPGSGVTDENGEILLSVTNGTTSPTVTNMTVTYEGETLSTSLQFKRAVDDGFLVMWYVEGDWDSADSEILSFTFREYLMSTGLPATFDTNVYFVLGAMGATCKIRKKGTSVWETLADNKGASFVLEGVPPNSDYSDSERTFEFTCNRGSSGQIAISWGKTVYYPPSLDFETN